MNKRLLLWAVLRICVLAVIAIYVHAQEPTPPKPKLALTTVVRKTVAGIETHCLRVPAAAELANMTPQARMRWQIPQFLVWTRAEKLSERPIAELDTLPQTITSGTAFFVFVPDSRIGENRGFQYLVTNKHVIRPGIEDSNPCTVLYYEVLVNSTGPSGAALHRFRMRADANWVTPDDAAVDLAAIPFGYADPSNYDVAQVALDWFVKPEMISSREVVEGDPVFFSGLFIQYHGRTKLEPIVRSGTVAMLPEEKTETTLHLQGNVYFAETHSFGGNSGSPMFVDIAKFKTGIGYSYKFLGVVAGTVRETSDFKLQINTNYGGTLYANSGVSVIVPAEEVRKLLFLPKLTDLREREVTTIIRNQQAPQEAAKEPTKKP